MFFSVRRRAGKFKKVLKIPGVMVATSSIIVTSMSIGFLQATLEPHLRQFKLTPVVLGLMFVINGGTYAITAPIWGWFCDKHSTPKVNERAINISNAFERKEYVCQFEIKSKVVSIDVTS